MKFVFWLTSSKIIRQAKKRDIEYSFMFVHPDGSQLAEIGKLLDAGDILPVIDKIFPFDQARRGVPTSKKAAPRGRWR